jgi:hypothetical protein
VCACAECWGLCWNLTRIGTQVKCSRDCARIVATEHSSREVQSFGVVRLIPNHDAFLCSVIFFTAMGSVILKRLPLNSCSARVFGSFNRYTNKMQFCNRIYYSKVYWRLNVFRAAHRSSSGALNCVCSLWFSTLMWWPVVAKVHTQPWQRQVTTWVYKPEAANTVRARDDERCAARNMLSLQ